MPKIILSRKGFDSSSGGYPSPIVGTKSISFPIPQKDTGISYAQVLVPGLNSSMENLAENLGIKLPASCHLDPDLCRETLSRREKGWKACFGQTGAALRHLENEKVGIGDLFLFFGWFKKTNLTKSGYSFEKKGRDLHVIFGYLEVGEVIDLSKQKAPHWASRHPHVEKSLLYNEKGNSLFVSSDHSSFWPGKKGAGWLDFDEKLVLTSPGEKSRSLWEVDPCFFDENRNCKLSYHRHKKGVQSGKQILLKSAPRGQEFVAEMDKDVAKWVSSLVPSQS